MLITIGAERVKLFYGCELFTNKKIARTQSSLHEILGRRQEKRRIWKGGHTSNIGVGFGFTMIECKCLIKGNTNVKR